MKQRHDDEEGIARRQRHAVRRAGAEGVQHRRAVAVHDALRIAGGAGGVAERRGGVLVEGRPVVLGRSFRQQVLVAEKRPDFDGRQALRFAERDPASHQRQLRRQLLDQRGEDRVEEHIGVLRMMHDVLKLIGEQPRIDGVEHAPRGGDAIIEFEMAAAVPGERGDAIARADAERAKRIGDPLRSRSDFRIIRTMDRPFGIPRDDLASAVPRRGVIDEARYQKRTLLHQSEHAFLPGLGRPMFN